MSGTLVYSNALERAVHFSIHVHEVNRPERQLRKGKNIAYITHPLTVGLILAHADADDEVVMAGILHDTIEDSHDDHKVTKEMIAEAFGGRVASLVDAVTENDRTLPWEERKNAALEHVAHFSHDMLFVKSADVISNMTELYTDFLIGGAPTFDRFNSPAALSLHYTGRLVDALIARWPESPLHEDLEAVAHKVAHMNRDITAAVA